MLKVRVIPTLLWKNFNLVKGVGFDSWRSIGSILPAIKVYNQREVDELILVNISAHLSSDDLDYISINEFGKPVDIEGNIIDEFAVFLITATINVLELLSNRDENFQLD